MVYEGLIKGRYVTLRSADASDVEYTLQIRQNKELNRFMHPVDNDPGKQLNWILGQRDREGDYFFVAQTLDGERVGTVSIYDIQGSSGHLGRLIMTGNPFCTFEATIMAMRFAYDELGLEELHGDVHVDNKASKNLSEAVGFHMKEPEFEPGLDRWVMYCTAYKSEFSTYEENIKGLIYREE